MTTYFLDLEGGNDSADGTSFADRVKTWAVASSLLAPGDSLRVMASPGPTAMSVNAAWTNLGSTVTLSAPVNADIEVCDSAWTPSSNVTCTTSTTRKEGRFSSSIAIAAGFTTGLAAYKAMAATDFSGYEQISFWIRQTSGTVAASAALSIKLCSDNAGATPVDTFDIPALGSTNTWHCFVVDKGSALGASIQSVALYVNTDAGAQTFLLDNIVAVKAAGDQDELHHRLLIGKQNSIGGGGDDDQTWYPIRSIRGGTIHLDSSYESQPDNDVPVCCNSSETITAYTFSPSYLPLTVAAADLLCVFPGLPSSRVSVSGGWDRVAMSSQTGYTIFGQQNGASAIPVWRITASDFSQLGYLRCSGTFNPPTLGMDSTFDRWQFLGGLSAQSSLVGDDLAITNSAFTGMNAFVFGGARATVNALFDAHNTPFTVQDGVVVTAANGSYINRYDVTTGQLVYNGTTYGNAVRSGNISPAEIRAAVGLATANLDTQLLAINNFIDTEVATIKAKTDNLPSDPADASDIASSFSTVNSTLATVAGYLDTEIAAIKAKTDLIPASPAAVGSEMTLTSGERDSIAGALLDLANGVESGITPRQALRGMAALLFGVVTGAGTGTEVFKNSAGDTTRVTVTVDADGNRSSIVANL